MRRLYLFIAIALLLCCAGCKKDPNVEVEVRMQPFTTQDQAKVYINNTYNPVWHEGDRLCINGQSVTVSGSSVSVPYSNYMYALYPAADMVSYSNGTYQVELPRVQTYMADNSGNQHIDALMAACGSGSSLVFANLCSLLKVTAPEQVTVLNIDVCSTDSSATMSGSGTVTFDGGAPHFAFGSSDKYPYTRLDCGTGVCRADRTYYIAVPAFTNTKLTITICGLANGKKFRHKYIQDQTSSLKASRYALVTLPSTYNYSSADSLYAGTDVLCEPFSVTRTVKKYFSKGNLQYRYKVDDHWRIALHQYDVIGNANNIVQYLDNPSIPEQYRNQWIDLFGWGTSNCQSGPNPWTSENNNSLYKVDADGSDNMTDATDWGKNIDGNWKTPTKQYWTYLLATRADAENKSAKAVIDGQYSGLLILPDYWVLPNGCSFATDVENTYSMTQWDAMEAAGALFLPAAGKRERYDIYSLGTDGYYWSASRKDNDHIYCLHFGPSTNVAEVTDDESHWGFSVRLIK